MCTSVTSLRVINQAPTVITSISTQVVTIVPLSSTKPYCQKTRSSGLRRNAGLLFQLARLFAGAGQPLHDETRAIRNPRRHATSLDQWPCETK